MVSPVALPSIPAVTHLSPLITRVLGHNPGPRTLQGTNSYLIGSPTRSRVLIDTTNHGSGLTAYLTELRKELERCTEAALPPLSAVICTHWHPDHTEAISAVLDLVRSITVEKRGLCCDPVPVFKHPGGPASFSVKGFQGPYLTLSDNQCIPVASSEPFNQVDLRVLYTPGHAADHVTLLLEVDAQPVALFTGDMILGHGSTMVNNLPDYMQSLYRTRELLLANQVPGTTSPMILYPAHGLEVLDSRKKVADYIDNRLDRIAKTVDYLSSQPADVWIPESDILQAVYPEVPRILQSAALLNLRHSLFWIQSSAAHELPASLRFRAAGLVARLPNGSHQVTVTEFAELIDAYEESLYQPNQKPPDTLSMRWEWKRPG